MKQCYLIALTIFCFSCFVLPELFAYSERHPSTAFEGTAGLSYKYYEGIWAAIPDSASLTPVQTKISGNTVTRSGARNAPNISLLLGKDTSKYRTP